MLDQQRLFWYLILVFETKSCVLV